MFQLIVAAVSVTVIMDTPETMGRVVVSATLDELVVIVAKV